MPQKKHFLQFLTLFVLSLSISGCSWWSSAPAVQEPAVVRDPVTQFRTLLLVRQPQGALPLNQAVVIESRTESPDKVSHAELYLVETPAGRGDLLVRSDAAPFDQVSFTATQSFVPTQVGHYVIKVVGYNKKGESTESDYMSFDVK